MEKNFISSNNFSVDPLAHQYIHEVFGKLLNTFESYRNQYPQLEQLERQIHHLTLQSASGGKPLYQCLRELMALLRIAKDTSTAGEELYLRVLGDIAYGAGKSIPKHAGAYYFN